MRCKICLKKIISGMQFKCKCGVDCLCIVCLNDKTHNCTYDFKKDKIVLKKVSSTKVVKI